MSRTEEMEHISGPVGRVVDQVAERREQAMEDGLIPADSEQAPLPVTAQEYAPAASILEVIERAAMNPDCDVEKMRGLLEMKKEIDNAEAERAFNEALAAAQAEMEPVARDADNKQTGSRYARLEAIAKAINPIRAKFGFSESYGTADCPIDDHYRVTCQLRHSAGYTQPYHADVPMDLAGIKGNANKTRTHAFGSTMSYGRRYLKLMIFDIATSDDDDGNAASQTVDLINLEQLDWLRQAFQDLGNDELGKFLRAAQIVRLEDLPQARFQGAQNTIEGKLKALSDA